MAGSIMLDKAKDFAVEIINMCKAIKEMKRKTISLYMQANNLKLSVGTHRFNRVDGTLEEYLNEEFKFETIK